MRADSTNAQVTTVPYSTSAFNALPEFDDSKARFDDKRHVLDALGEIIRAHGVEKYLGAALIHKHFHLLEGERIVERVEEKGSLLSPQFGIAEDSLTPYLWHLSSTGPADFQWTPVEYVLSETIPDAVQGLAVDIPQRETLLAELAEVLAGASD
jgi:hypothetical protein